MGPKQKAQMPTKVGGTVKLPRGVTSEVQGDEGDVAAESKITGAIDE